MPDDEGLTPVRTMSDFRPLLVGTNSRFFLLVLSEVNLVLGALFFVQPEIAAGLWPWPVKALAVRFLGATFLAIALGCWSARHAKVWQRAKILVLVGASYFGLSSIITAGVGVSQIGNYGIWAWTGYFLAATLGLLAILKIHGWSRRPQDRIALEPPWRTARGFFRIQTVLVGVFGTFMLLLPDLALDQFWPWDVALSTVQIFAALFLATCLATGWASLQTERARIRALLPLDAVFPALALLAVGIHWTVVQSESPSYLVTGVWVFVYAFVATGSTYLFFQSRARDKTRGN